MISGCSCDVDVPEEAARGAMLGAGLPAWMVEAMMELHAIDKAERSEDIARGVAEAIRVYLQERWLWETVPTTTEEAAAMLESQFEIPKLHDANTRTVLFLRRCDGVQFSLMKDATLVSDARKLISSWESS